MLVEFLSVVDACAVRWWCSRQS